MTLRLLLASALALSACSDGDSGAANVFITVVDGSDFSTLEQIAAPPSRSLAIIESAITPASIVSVTDAREPTVTLLARDDDFAVRSYAGPLARGVAAGDIDGDGVQDVLVLGEGQLANYKLERSGELELVRTYVAFTDRAIVVADLDHDSAPDVVSVGVGEHGGIVEVRKNASGELSGATTYDCGMLPTGLAVADLDRDGMTDIAVANLGSSSITILWGSSGGAFHRQDIPSASGAHDVLAVDLDDDGDRDLVVAGLSELEFLFNASDGAFESHRFALPTPGGQPWALGELPAPDGSIQIVGADASNASIWVSSRTTGYVPKLTGVRTAPDPIALAVGDINGDAIPDIVVGSYGVAPVL